ncbi:MAG: histidinol-phosphate aminotransferase [Acidobacteriota bacterium]|jgi:histidinol-phosphate aminotransferase|nr:histidinol-phosphate aminotransferase [Acidobacteriota bacterium]
MIASTIAARDAVRAMKAYTLELRDAATKLNQNESPFDFPEALKREVLERVAQRPWNVYPEFEATRLRAALAAAYDIPAQSLLAGNGSNELLAAAIATFVEPGRRVAFARPTFALYEKLITIAGGEPLPIDFDPRSGELPLDRLVAAVERDGASVVIVCSPNNPTGGVLARGGIERLLKTGAVVLFDRAYGDFDDDDSLPPPDDRLVVCSTFSKAWGLAALRLGWLCSTPATAAEIRKAKLPYSLNIVSEETAIVALEHRRYRDANVAAIISERERLYAAMRELDGIEPFPSRANFITFRCRDARATFDALCAGGILIRDVSAYPNLDGCLRVSVGTREENDRFLTALENLV